MSTAAWSTLLREILQATLVRGREEWELRTEGHFLTGLNCTNWREEAEGSLPWSELISHACHSWTFVGWLNQLFSNLSNLSLRRCMVGPHDDYYCGLRLVSEVFSWKTYWRWKLIQRIRSSQFLYNIKWKVSAPCQECSSWLFLFRKVLKRNK